MADLNRVFLLGRLTRDPTLRHTPGGTPVAEFGIAVNRTWSGPNGERKEETCFVDIVVWSRRAEVCHANLRRSSPVFVEGRLHLDTWSSASGEKRSRLKVVANNVVFLNPPPRGERAPQARGAGGGRPAPRRADAPVPAENPPPDRQEPADAADAASGTGGSPPDPEDAGGPTEGPGRGAEVPRGEDDLPAPGETSDFPF